MEETNQKLNSAAPDTVSETLEETDVFSGELENVEEFSATSVQNATECHRTHSERF